MDEPTLNYVLDENLAKLEFNKTNLKWLLVILFSDRKNNPVYIRENSV